MKNINSVIYFIIIFLFINQAWASDWIYFDTSAVGGVYYEKSSIKKVNKNIISVWIKNILSEEAKTKYYSILKGIDEAPDNPSMLCYYTKLTEIDCVNRKIKDISVIFCDEKGRVVYSSPESESSEWNDILPNTVGEKLIKIVSCEPITLNKAVVAAPAVTDKNLAQVNSKQSDWVKFNTSKKNHVTSYKKVTTEKGQEKFVVIEVYSDKDREELIKKMKDNNMSTERYDKLKETMSLYEIDCNKKRKNILSITDYDMDDKVLLTYSYDKKEWVFIVPDSQFDSLRKEVCK